MIAAATALDDAAPNARSSASRPPARLRFGHIDVDPVTFHEAVDAIERLVVDRRGGCVFTPNVDHVVKAERDPEFREAYARASLSVADGMPLVWASRLFEPVLPEKVSGSDLVYPLCARAARRGWRVYLLGGAPGVGDRAAAQLHRRFGLTAVAVDAAPITLDARGERESQAVVERVRRARADLLLVALGAPKQEIWIHRHLEALRPAVAIGLGATLDFVAGTRRRAPRWMSRCGLEWMHRLTHEPRRLWRRYLVDDPHFAGIVWRSLKLRGASC